MPKVNTYLGDATLLQKLSTPSDTPSDDSTLGERVFRRMLDQIYAGELPLGAVINESAIAGEFGVSRGPVREAVRRLQGIQLVSREPYVKARVISLGPRQIADLFEMREALEGYACRLAARVMTDAEIEGLEADLEEARTSILNGTPPQEFAEPTDFHVRIVRGCGNQRIIGALCGDLYHLLRIYRQRSGSIADRRSAAYQEHWQILRAIKCRDGDLAESLMRSHIARAAQQLARHLPEADDPAGTRVA